MSLFLAVKVCLGAHFQGSNHVQIFQRASLTFPDAPPPPPFTHRMKYNCHVILDYVKLTVLKEHFYDVS